MEYAKKNREYAAQYGVAERVISSWRKADAPLDDVGAMIEWRTARQSRRGVSKFAKKQPIATAAIEEDENFQAAQFSDGTGLAAAIQRFREAEKLASEHYARVAHRPALAGPALQNWILVADQLRKIEKDNPEIARQNDKSVDIDVVEAQWSQGFAAFAGALDAIPQRMAKVLEGLDAVAIQEKLKNEVRITLEAFRDPDRVKVEDLV